MPTGEVVTVEHRVPLYTLARELDKRGYGDYRLQSYTPTGTPSFRGLVSVMAGLTVTERDNKGLRLEKYRPFDRRGGLAQRDPAPECMPHPLKQRRSPVSPQGRLHELTFSQADNDHFGGRAVCG